MECFSLGLGMVGLLLCIGAFAYRYKFCRKYFSNPYLFRLYLLGTASIGLCSIISAFIEFSNRFAISFATLQIAWCAVSTASIFTTPNKFEIPGFYIVAFTVFCGCCIGMADQGTEPMRPYVHLVIFGLAVLIVPLVALKSLIERRGVESRIIYQVKPDS